MATAMMTEENVKFQAKVAPKVKTEAEIMAALAAPFEKGSVKFRAGACTKDKTRCMAIAYIDARCVMDRLDAALGMSNWQDSYELSADGTTATCKLSIRINGEWITKSDIGSCSEQEDAGDRKKSAVSDSLKRCAVHFGVGRYLYNAQVQWVEYDAVRKCLKTTPQLIMKK